MVLTNSVKGVENNGMMSTLKWFNGDDQEFGYDIMKDEARVDDKRENSRNKS